MWLLEDLSLWPWINWKKTQVTNKQGINNMFGLAMIPLTALLAASLASPSKPNVVLFLQDDQDEALGGWTPMKQTTKLISAAGATAKNWFIHTPVCCPSRAELLSGRYFHNVVVDPGTHGGCMHVDENKVNPVSAWAKMGALGYTVGWFGKHMNACPRTPPPGFDCDTCWFFANGGGSDSEPGGFLNATFNDYAGSALPPLGSVNGTYHASTAGEFSGYTTSVIANKSIAWLNVVGKLDKPFLVTIASKGPHVPATPAPWYQTGTFVDKLAAPRNAAFNASADVLADHHWLIAQQQPITQSQGAEIDNLFRDRWRTLLSIDDAVAGVHAAVADLGLLDKTYFLITSDHGYNLGQHRLPSCKLNVYDHDIRIPMVISGPGIKPGSSFDFPASNVDVGPSLLGLAGVLDVSQFDGRSVVAQLVDPTDPTVADSTRAHILHSTKPTAAEGGGWRDFHLVEYYSLGKVTRTGHLVDDPVSNTYRAIRSTRGKFGNILYAEFTSVGDMWTFTNVTFHEMYDMDKDPHQLDNIYSSQPNQVKRALAALLAKEFRCRGETCM